MSPRVAFESCVESFEAAVASAAGGAARIELCADLDVGGTTPDAALLSRTVLAVPIPVFAMVRPRGGSFVYGADEVRALEHDILAMAAAGAHGIVVGALDRRGDVDVELMRRLIAVARPLPVTCHKAFDDARDLSAALDALVALGVDRVLTSGGSPSAAEGAEVIARLVRQAGDRLAVMAGGGIRRHNVADLVRRTGVREVHARLPCSSEGDGPAVVAEFVNALPKDDRKYWNEC